MEDKVSIITPSWNSERYIRETIKSVQNQTYSNWEMIIVDDCSSDNTVKIVEEISKNDSRVKSEYRIYSWQGECDCRCSEQKGLLQQSNSQAVSIGSL